MKSIFSLAFLFLPFFALAHATPLEYDPAPNTLLPERVQSVTITFNERLEKRASSIRVYDPLGSQIDMGGEELDASFRTLSVAAGSQMRGTYSVAWQVLSADDGHITKGAYSFSVGTTTGASSVTTFEQRRSLFEGTGVGIELLGSALLLGVLVIRFVARREGEEVWELVRKNGNHLVCVGATLAFLGGSLFFVSKSTELGGGIESLAILARTAAGAGTIERILHVFALTLLWYGFQVRLRRFSWTDGVFLILLLASTLVRTKISHAAASLFMPELSVAINFVHLVFKEVWIGGVVAFVYILWPLLGARGEQLEKVRVAFSRVVTYAFLVGGISGTYVVWLHLKSFGNMSTTLWGKEFVVLSAFAGLLLLARIVGELVPRMRVRALVWEAFIAVCITLVTGLIIITTPPISHRGLFAGSVYDQGVRFTLLESEQARDFLLDIDTDAFSREQLVVEGFEQEKNIGPLPLSLSETKSNSFVISRAELTPPGKWTISATLLQPKSYDAHARFPVDTQPEDSLSYDFDLFDAVMLATVGGVVASFFLARKFLL